MAQAVEALRHIQQRQMGRREFFGLVGKGAAGLAVSAIFLDRLGGLATADTSVETFTDPHVVAGLYGWDNISRDARFWHPTPNGDGGWVFDSTLGDGVTFQGDGKPHGIFVGGADGRGAEMIGWLKIPTPSGDFTGLIAAHRNAGLVEAIQATIYRHKDPDAGWINLADGIKNNRQPGQIWMPVNEAPLVTNQGDIPLFPIGTNVDAARMFGVPGTLSGDANNWTVVDDGPQGDRFATITAPNGTNAGIKLWSPEQQIWPNGSMWPVAQGEIVKSGSLPSRFTAHPIVGEIFGTKITIRLTTNPNANWRNSLSDIESQVRAQGGGINVLPIIR